MFRILNSEIAQLEQRASDATARLETARSGLDETLPKLEAAEFELVQSNERLALEKARLSDLIRQKNELKSVDSQ